MRFLNCGILADPDPDELKSTQTDGLLANLRPNVIENKVDSIARAQAIAQPEIITNHKMVSETDMPPAWVKSAMLVRANSLSYGISGVRVTLLANLVQLLEHNLVPKVPLRGSISASGDLIPLSYVANTLQGSPGIKVPIWSNGKQKLVGADIALQEAGIPSIEFAPKEALALVNGTSFSAGTAALILHDLHVHVVLAQILTAMAVEALHGARESFDPYFAEVRPHPGQKEVAQNIDAFLWKSKLVKEEIGKSDIGLAQDRYSIRTVSQWLGQEVENLVLSHNQVVTECNSLTDNPLMAPDGRVMQGGNFQATSITLAMDRSRCTLQMSGRMLFQQLTEMMNPPTNNGLPPALTADEPSCDFVMKGVDVAAASYASELAFLSQGMSPFVMNAEQGNQSLNSLALISARYTQTAVNVFGHLAATVLVAYCQALDLRAVQRNFVARFADSFHRETKEWTQTWLKEGSETGIDAVTQLWTQFMLKFGDTANFDLAERFRSIMKSLCESARQIGRAGQCESEPRFFQDLDRWSASLSASAQTTYKDVLDRHSVSDTLAYLGAASRKMYWFVRDTQQVPFLRRQQQSSVSKESVFMGANRGETLGTYITRIYQTLQRGSLLPVVMECLEEATTRAKQAGQKARL